jgi:DNA polymerase I-like protein with 3'-5' exonuclease and polymerase domains
MDEELYRKAFAQRPQASIVTVTNIGVRRLVSSGYRVAAQVHDSIVIEVPEEDILVAARDLDAAMTTPVTTWGGTITIPVEIKAGHSWGDMDEVSIHSEVSNQSGDELNRPGLGSL